MSRRRGSDRRHRIALFLFGVAAALSLVVRSISSSSSSHGRVSTPSSRKIYSKNNRKLDPPQDRRRGTCDDREDCDSIPTDATNGEPNGTITNTTNNHTTTNDNDNGTTSSTTQSTFLALMVFGSFLLIYCSFCYCLCCCGSSAPYTMDEELETSMFPNSDTRTEAITIYPDDSNNNVDKDDDDDENVNNTDDPNNRNNNTNTNNTDAATDPIPTGINNNNSAAAATQYSTTTTDPT